MKEKPGGYDEPACLQAFDALTTHLTIFATRCTLLEKLYRRKKTSLQTKCRMLNIFLETTMRGVPLTASHLLQLMSAMLLKTLS